MNARNIHFPLMDSVRGIAVIAVIVLHTAFFAAIFDNHETIARFAAQLDVSLTMFFVISGFLLYRPFVVAQVEGDPRPRTAAYGWRRLLRIVPAYWLALTLTLVTLGTAGASAGDLVSYYAFSHVYTDAPVIVAMAQAWSLCVEVSYYALLPAYALALRAVGRRWGGFRLELAGLAVLVAVSVAFKLLHLSTGELGEQATGWQLTMPTYLDQLAIGMLVAVVSVRHPPGTTLPRAIRLVERAPAISWAVAVAAFVTVSQAIDVRTQSGAPLTDGEFMLRHYLYGLVALGLLLPAVFGEPRQGVVRKILSSRALLFVGTISYGLFLYHLPVLHQLQQWDLASVAADAGAWLWFTCAAAFAGVMAVISWFGLERPALTLKRLVSWRGGRREEPPAREPATLAVD